VDSALYAALSRRRRASSFAPDQVAGLHSWYDSSFGAWADASATLAATDGAGVARWDDRSGNARHLLQSTAASRPTFRAAQANGRPCLRLDGINDFLAASNLALTGNALTVYAVYLRSSATTQQNPRVVALRSTDAANDYDNPRSVIPIGYSGSATNPLGYYNLTDGAARAGANDTLYLAVSRWSGTQHEMRLNGASATAGVTLSGLSAEEIMLGRPAHSDSEHLAGDFYEVLVYESNVVGADAANLEAYLKGRYGLSY
jgi:hypothetical protein